MRLELSLPKQAVLERGRSRNDHIPCQDRAFCCRMDFCTPGPSKTLHTLKISGGIHFWLIELFLCNPLCLKRILVHEPPFENLLYRLSKVERVHNKALESLSECSRTWAYLVWLAGTTSDFVVIDRLVFFIRRASTADTIHVEHWKLPA